MKLKNIVAKKGKTKKVEVSKLKLNIYLYPNLRRIVTYSSNLKK